MAGLRLQRKLSSRLRTGCSLSLVTFAFSSCLVILLECLSFFPLSLFPFPSQAWANIFRVSLRNPNVQRKSNRPNILPLKSVILEEGVDHVDDLSFLSAQGIFLLLWLFGHLDLFLNSELMIFRKPLRSSSPKSRSSVVYCRIRISWRPSLASSSHGQSLITICDL